MPTSRNNPIRNNYDRFGQYSHGVVEREVNGVQDLWSAEFVRERSARLLEEAEERRLARLAAGTAERPSLRALAARRLFGAAVVLEREETWRAVWERLEAPRHP